MTKTLLLSAVATLGFSFYASAQLQSENFEANAIPDGWTEEISGPGNWTFGSNIPPFSGNPTFASNAAIFNDDALGSGPSSVGSLLSPPIDLTTNANVNLAFDYYLNEFSGGLLRVEVFTGSAWQQLLLVEADVINMTSVSYDVTDYKNSAFQVKFTFDDESAWSWGAAIDNFLLTESLTIQDHRAPTTLSLYPNPVSDVLHIASDSGIKSVSVSDLSGKLLLKREISGTTGLLDVSALSAGVYVLTAAYDDDRLHPIKFLKKLNHSFLEKASVKN